MKLVLAYSLLALAAACGDNLTGNRPIDSNTAGDGGTDAPPDAPDGTTVLRSTLSGFQEVPPVFADARGTAVLGVNEAKTEITVELAYADLTGITAAHIHAGKPGVNGDVLFTLATADFASPLTKTLTEADFTPAGGIATFADAVQAILDGNTHLNVHTTDNPGGALRGHVGKTTLTAIGSARQENPPVTSPATGTATITLDDAQDTISVSFDTDMVANAMSAHIHVGEVGRNGPVIFDLGTPADPIVAMLEEGQLAPNPEAGIATMRDAVDAVLSGRAYLNVHTTANPGGELRAQVGAVTLRASLSGGQVRPAPVSTMAKGRAFVTISGDQTTITTNTTYTGITTANVTGAHLHVGNFDTAGAATPTFVLGGAGFASGTTKVLTAADFTAGTGVPTFAGAINLLLAGGVYVDVHATGNPGQIRGQVGRVFLHAPVMTALKQRPIGIDIGASGSLELRVAGDQRSVFATVTYEGLSSLTTGADIRIGTPTTQTTDAPTLFPVTAATFASGTTFELDSEDLATSAGVMNMADAIGRLLDEATFANVKTMDRANGEIRDQIVADPNP